MCHGMSVEVRGANDLLGICPSASGGEWRLGPVCPEPSSLLLTLLQTVVCRNLGTCTHLDLLRIASHSLRVTSSPAPALRPVVFTSLTLGNDPEGRCFCEMEKSGETQVVWISAMLDL